MRFLAIGECMAELAPTAKNDEYRLGFAGDTFNTAWYLARCAPEVKVTYLTAVGDDAISEKMTAFMRDSGISDAHVQIASGKTVGLYLISLEQGERSFSYWRGQSAARSLASDAAALDAAMADADLIYFSGISLGILASDDRTTFLDGLRKARDAGKTIAFDPNLRPKLWVSESEMIEATMQGAAVSDLVLPSFEDEADWFGDANPKATADRYHSVGAVTAIVKNGAGPVFYSEGDVQGEIAVSPTDNLVDSTAAGDSFNAGVFACSAAGASLEDSVVYACALSRAVVQARGALVPIEPPQLP